MPVRPIIILIADDDPEDLELFGEALKREEPATKLHSVLNGRAVIDHLDSRQDDELPCLIILDYNMPQLTGSQVLSHICKEPRYEAIPKVILSTSNAPSHMHECMNNGATAYFIKPDNMTELHTLAKRLIEICRFN